MTAALSAPAEDRSSADPFGPEVVTRRVALLDRLIEIGVRILEPLPDENRPAGERANAFAKISRAIRLCIMLQHRLMTEPRPRPLPPIHAIPPPPAEDLDPAALLKRELEAVERCLETPDRLDAEDLDHLIATHSFDELVAMVCQDLGLPEDWAKPPPQSVGRGTAEGGGGGEPHAPALAARPLQQRSISPPPTGPP